MSNQEIREIGDVPQREIELFFERRGIDSSTTRWKYFDAEFNSGRNRGYVALSDNRPVGFIGLIPFRAASGSTIIDTAWTCDWHIDEEHRTSMIGIMLLKKAIAAYPSVFHIGGNEKTRKVFVRLASDCDATGVNEFRCDLRLGAPIRRMSSWMRWPRALTADLLARVPLVGRLRKDSSRGAMLEKGLTEDVLSVFSQQHHETDYHPAYDQNYIKWQVGRSPEIKCFSYLSDHGTAAVVWYLQRPDSEWRMILGQAAPDASDLESCIKTAKLLAYEQGADSIRILTSRQDADLRSSLKACGFDERNSYHYYSFHQDQDRGPAECMSGLSFLDVDFVYL